MTTNNEHHEKKEVPRYKIRLAIFHGPDQQTLMTQYSVNISTGGLFLETTRIVPVDTLLHVEFMLPGKNNPISCKAKVAWTNEPDALKKPSLPPGMGLQFLTLSLDDIHTIQDFLSNYEIVPTW